MKSAVAVFVGFIIVAILSVGTDQILHVLNVYPPWGVPMNDPALNFLALAYRIVYTMLGGYVTAQLAPRAPMRHVWILGGIGFVFACMGVVVGLQKPLGPIWYPILLAVTTFPSVWIGGRVYCAKHREKV